VTDGPLRGPSAVERLLTEARRTLERVRPGDLDAEVAAGAIVVDIRPESDRTSEGAIPGSVALERNVLEWRLDPTSADRIAEATDPSIRVIVVCNDGYASSLAARSLQLLGLHRATDLEGGYRAWRRQRPS